TFAGPVRDEILWEQKHAKILEAESLQRLDGGRDIRAFFHRAAAAVNYQVGCAGNSGGPGGQLFQAFFASRRAVGLSTLDVSRIVKPLESHEDDGRRRFRIAEFLNQFRSLNRLGF